MNTMNVNKNIQTLVKRMLYALKKLKTQKFQLVHSYWCYYIQDTFYGVLPIYAPVVIRRY